MSAFRPTYRKSSCAFVSSSSGLEGALLRSWVFSLASGRKPWIGAFKPKDFPASVGALNTPESTLQPRMADLWNIHTRLGHDALQCTQMATLLEQRSEYFWSSQVSQVSGRHSLTARGFEPLLWSSASPYSSGSMAHFPSPQFAMNNTLLGECNKAKYGLNVKAVYLLLLRQNLIASPLFCSPLKALSISLNLKDVVHARGKVVGKTLSLFRSPIKNISKEHSGTTCWHWWCDPGEIPKKEKQACCSPAVECWHRWCDPGEILKKEQQACCSPAAENLLQSPRDQAESCSASRALVGQMKL